MKRCKYKAGMIGGRDESQVWSETEMGRERVVDHLLCQLVCDRLVDKV